MDEDRLVVVLAITNIIKKVELFRIHVYENSIRFDNHFSEGINKHPELSEDVSEINRLWKNKEIDREKLYMNMVRIMYKYHDYLKNFYFKEYELDKEGHYIEPINMQETTSKPPSKAALHYLYLKQSKRLKRISKKEFEKNINTDEIANYYVDNYVKKGARFYSHIKMAPKNKNMVTWYFMVVNQEFKISFTSIGDTKITK